MAGTKKVDKNCEDCGVLMTNVAPLRRLCYDCARKRKRAGERQRAYTYKIIRPPKAKPVMQGTPIINRNAKYCKGCFYWGGHDESACCCNYLLITDKRRPCPPGKNCTVRK